MAEFVLHSFNPYSSRYPNRRVITREQLHLAKLLRAEGATISIDGDPSHELNYLALKGVHEWLADPIVLLVLGVPISVACNLLSNVIYDLAKGRKSRSTDVLIEMDEGGVRGHFASDGEPLSDAQFSSLVSAMNERHAVQHLTPQVPPNPSRPVPIYLEHSDRIVAWGRLAVDDHGLAVEDALVFDDETWVWIESGALRGMSIGALVRKATCSICRQSYFDCPHLATDSYDGVPCIVTLEELDLGEVSLVQNPANPLARVHRLGSDEYTAG